MQLTIAKRSHGLLQISNTELVEVLDPDENETFDGNSMYLIYQRQSLPLNVKFDFYKMHNVKNYTLNEPTFRAVSYGLVKMTLCEWGK